MASFRFQIEVIDPEGRYVLARYLDAGAPFRVLPGARLGECEVLGMIQPRVFAPDGSPRLDIYGFRVKDPHDARTLMVGQIVLLRADVISIQSFRRGPSRPPSSR